MRRDGSAERVEKLNAIDSGREGRAEDPPDDPDDLVGVRVIAPDLNILRE